MRKTSFFRRDVFLLLLATALALGFAGNSTRAHNLYDQTVNVVSFGGDYTRSQMLSMVRPWEAASGKFVNMSDYGGGIAEIRSQVNSANVSWDVVDMEYADLIAACDAGLLEPADASLMANGDDGTPASDDISAGSMGDCGYPSVIWATVYAYSTDAFADRKPSTIADFFDVESFPGKRGMRQNPRGFLEWALIAAGVAPDQVYATLSTPEGLQMAFDQASVLKPHIVWWSGGSEPVELLTSGAVTMSAAWNGRLYRPIVEQKLPIDIVWDGQMWEIEYFAIPKGTPRMANAKEFIRFATGTGPLAQMSNHISYGPIRASSSQLVDEAITPFLPTSNMGNALRVDSRWWAQNMNQVEEAFENWLSPPSIDEAERAVRF